MLIKDLRNKGKPSYGQILNVYVIYWVDDVRYYLVSPQKHEGLIVISEKDSEVVDEELGEGMLIKKNPNGGDIILHSVLDKNFLLDRLIDDGQGNYAEFVENLGREP